MGLTPLALLSPGKPHHSPAPGLFLQVQGHRAAPAAQGPLEGGLGHLRDPALLHAEGAGPCAGPLPGRRRCVGPVRPRGRAPQTSPTFPRALPPGEPRPRCRVAGLGEVLHISGCLRDSVMGHPGTGVLAGTAVPGEPDAETLLRGARVRSHAPCSGLRGHLGTASSATPPPSFPPQSPSLPGLSSALEAHGPSSHTSGSALRVQARLFSKQWPGVARCQNSSCLPSASRMLETAPRVRSTWHRVTQRGRLPRVPPSPHML